MICYALADTVLGWAGLAWGKGGLVRVHLPEGSAALTRDALHARFPEALETPAPATLAPVIAGIQALLAGGRADLSMAPLDLAQVPEFNARVYEITRRIPAGETLTYGEVAGRLGDVRLARAVGVALGRNPWPLIVPCHRITAAGGALGGFSARGGSRTKWRLLAIERALAASQGELFPS
jgi:methylated-DNA-[protein]-cysteine S-methyltransferase